VYSVNIVPICVDLRLGVYYLLVGSSELLKQRATEASLFSASDSGKVATFFEKSYG